MARGVRVNRNGAFDGTISNDIRALINHDARLVLGRNKSGTLDLKVDSRGLWGSVKVNEKDVDAMNLYERVKRGDVDQCSFGFNILAEETEFRDDGSIKWIIKEIDLHEVSVVTFPAYEETGVQARHKDLEQMKKRMQEEKKTEIKGEDKCLKQLMLRKKINSARAALEEFLKADNFQQRSADLEAAIAEAETDEEIAAVEDEIKQLEDEQTTFEKKSSLEEEVRKLESELKEIEENQPKAGEGTEGRSKENKGQIRGGQETMLTRYKAFKGMQRAQVEELIKRDDVQEF